MIVGLDTETSLISESEPVPRLVSVQICRGATVDVHAAHESDLPSIVAAAFGGGVALLNAPFDVFVLLRWCPSLYATIAAAYSAERVHAIDLREKLIDISEGLHHRRGGYGLAAVAQRRAGIELDKSADTWRLRYGELLGLEVSDWPEDARRYARDDASATLAVYHAQERYAAGAPGPDGHVTVAYPGPDGWDVAHRLCVPLLANAPAQACAQLALYAQTLHGMHTDQPRVRALGQWYETELDALTRRVLDSGLARVGGTKKAPKVVRDTKRASAMLVAHAEEHGIKLEYTTRGASLSEDSLTSADLPPGHPLYDYRLLGATQALRAKTMPSLYHPIVRTRYDACVETGRTSSSAPGDMWVGTNLQNMAKACACAGQCSSTVPGDSRACVGSPRECLIPPPPGAGLGHLDGYMPGAPAPHGYRYAISDFSGAELVTLAQIQIDLFGRSALGDALRSGVDVHAQLGADLLKIPRAAFTKSHPEYKRGRTLAKPVNFGFPGGLGAQSFCAFARTQYGVELTEDEARQCKKIWLSTWPEMELYLDHIAGLEGSAGLIDLVQPRSGRIRGRCGYTEACNSLFQGLASDAAKLSLWWLWLAQHDSASPLHRCPQVLFVHDEHVTLVPSDPAHDPATGPTSDAWSSSSRCGCRSCAAVAEQERIMIAAFAEFCPAVPVRVESSVRDRYGK